MTRRSFSRLAALGTALTPTIGAWQPQRQTAAGSKVRLAVSTYSYWHLRGERYPIEKVIENAADLGFDGVEILHRQMESESTQYVNKLKQLAFRHGLAIPMLSIHQDFVAPDAAERRKDVEHTLRCIDLAAQLGAPAVRLNSGRWNTIASFDDLMKVKGAEPPIAGYTNDDAFKWVVESIRACLPQAEKMGVVTCLGKPLGTYDRCRHAAPNLEGS